MSPIPGAPGCPHSQWTESITDLRFTGAAIPVEQPPGTLVLTETCTMSPASSTGGVPAGAVSCSRS